MNIREKLANINSVLPILVIAEIIYLIAGEIIILFTPLDKPTCMFGFAIGVGLAIFSSIQNALMLNKSVTAEKVTKSGAVWGYIIRLIVFGAVVAIAFFTRFVNPVAILIGLLSIQAGVYFVPFVKDKSKNEKNSNSENNTDEKKL